MDQTVSSVISAFPIAALVVTVEGRIASANDKAIALFGENIVNRPFALAFRSPQANAGLESALSSGLPGAVDLPGATFAGTKSNLRVYFSGFDLDGAWQMLVSFVDLTDQIAAQDMRRDFVANLSHELRTPLTAILGFVETLSGPAKDDAVARDHFLAIMRRETERMAHLVDDLLTLSRVEDEERRRPRESVDLVAVVKGAVSILDQTAQRAGVQIETSFFEAQINVQGHEEQLRQVLLNLTENAVKYGGKGGTVRISVHQRGKDQIDIVVADKGEGIAPHHIHRLTERFYRVDTHRSREVGGTGLGLAIVKHIVNRHRGRLKIESQLGQGTQVTVSLPVK